MMTATAKETTTVKLNLNCGCGYKTTAIGEAREHVAATGHVMTDCRIAILPKKKAR